MNLSENIKSIREEKKISQSELAKRLGVEPTNYPRIEKRGNNLTYEYIELFAKALEVSVTELLRGTNEPVENPDFEKLKKENADLKSSIKVLEDYNRLLKNELEEYESLIFDNKMNFTFDKFIKVLFVASLFRSLMESFFEREDDIKEGYPDMTASRINKQFDELMNLEEFSPLIDLIFNNNKLLKSAIIQEDGRIDVILFRKEYNELLKNYKNEEKSKK